MTVNPNCKYLCEEVIPLFEGLRKVAQAEWSLHFQAREIIYKGVFAPTVAYAAASWIHRCNVHDMRILRDLHRRALIPVTTAYRTVSYDAICVLAGVLPIDLLLEERCAGYLLKRDGLAEVGGVVIRGGDDAKSRIREALTNVWQDRWAGSEKGRVTFAFFGDVRERMERRWLKPCFYSAQVLTGLCKVERTCECGVADTPEHLLTECSEYDPQREALKELIADVDWAEAARKLFSTEENISLFRDFCRETVYLKYQAHG